MNRFLCCPKCYQHYEVQEEIYESVQKFKCFHCETLDFKEKFNASKPAVSENFNKKSSKSKETELPNFAEIPVKEVIEDTREIIKESITMEKIDLNTQNPSSTSNEVVKRLAIMGAGLFLLGLFVFLMIRK